MNNPQAEAVVHRLLEGMSKEEAVEYLKGMPSEVRKNYVVWYSAYSGYSFGPSHGARMVGTADEFLSEDAQETP